ncbi:MAG TPA: HNH endonuclease signature motif containing protein [Nocardioides sp.]|nr:HNH endonuclease signature motif containing protein [Nocardioides sp.]
MSAKAVAESASQARPESAAGVLAAARVERKTADLAEARLLVLAVQWALMHPADSDRGQDAATYTWRSWAGVEDTGLALAGDGAPTVAEYAIAEFAAAVGLGTGAGKAYLGQALELAYRLPRLWARVTGGELPAWRARRVAEQTIGLTRQAAAYVDTHVAGVAHKIGPAQLDRTVNEAIGRYMPEEVQRLAEASWDKRHVTIDDQLVSFTGTMSLSAELDIADALDLEAAVTAGAAARAELGSTESLDVRRAQAVGDLARGQAPLDLLPHHTAETPSDPNTPGDPVGSAGGQTAPGGRPRVAPRQVVLYVHLSEAAVRGEDPVARLERGDALVTADQVRAWCGRPDTAQIVVKPVLDLDTCTSSDSDRVTPPIAEHVAVRDKTCVFPWCTRPARTCHPDDPGEHPCDCDHAHPRSKNGPTCSCNLAPLCRRHHRLKTHSPWTYLVLDPGTYLWTSPHGYQFLRDPVGTLDVSQDRPRPKPPDT